MSSNVESVGRSATPPSRTLATDHSEQESPGLTRRLPAEGTGAAYIRRRLRRNHPELYARVVSGELSVNAAAIEAGFRQRTTTISIQTPAAAIRALRRVFSADELRAALDEIEDKRDATVAAAIAQALKAVDEAREVMRDPAEP